MMYKDTKLPLESNQACEWDATWGEELMFGAINAFIVFSFPMHVIYSTSLPLFSLICI